MIVRELLHISVLTPSPLPLQNMHLEKNVRSLKIPCLNLFELHGLALLDC